MTTGLFIATVLLFLAVMLWVGVRGMWEKPTSIEVLSGRLYPINLAALENLLDPEQDRYLMHHLSAGELRSIRRQRAHVAMGYVWKIAHNAAVLMRAADLAMRSPSADLASTGSRIAGAALRTRLWALQVLAALTVTLLFPARPLGSSIIDQSTELDTNIHVLTLAFEHAARTPR